MVEVIYASKKSESLLCRTSRRQLIRAAWSRFDEREGSRKSPHFSGVFGMFDVMPRVDSEVISCDGDHG
jgi:hypothetical protein